MKKNVRTDILQHLKFVEKILSEIKTNPDATFKFKYKITSEENSLRKVTIKMDEKNFLSVKLTGNGQPMEFFDINPDGEHFPNILKAIENHMG